MNIKKR